jgi:REP element-mobilizing transposase RayT
MPRQARMKCESQTYHVILRGINQQLIFEDTEDYNQFLQILEEYRMSCGFALYAYCLMNNHVHLLFKVQKEPLEKIMGNIATKYACWFNVKYQRIGHLFQGRFKSEPVEDEQYLLTALRYIHQNPVKAGLCQTADGYQYSSYHEYVGDGHMIDKAYIYLHISPSDFVLMHSRVEAAQCLDIESFEQALRVTDEQAREIILEHTACASVSDFQRLDIAKRNEYLKLLKKEGLSIRQICRLTGISFNIVKRA